MKQFLLIVFSCLSTFLTVSAQDFKLLTQVPQSDTESFFKINHDGVIVNNEVIQEFAINKEYVTVTYKNKTSKEILPEYTLKLYNGYGFLLATKKVSSGLLGGSPLLKPNDIGGDKIYTKRIDLNHLFQFTNFKLPEDFNQIKWLSISESNFKTSN